MESIKDTKKKSEPVIDSGGNKFWYNSRGQLHRIDGPAIEFFSGDKAWYKNGFLHREDGPSIEWIGGHKEWHINNRLHRIDGPAVIRADGTKKWWISGKLHRIDGPAIEYTNGNKEWWFNGKLHRIDGPAIEWENANENELRIKRWYIKGKLYSEEEFNEAVSFPDLAIPYIILRNEIYFIKFRENVGIRIDYFAEAYLNGKYIKLNEEIKELLLQFVKCLERFEPLLDWIQENSSYFPSEFIERLYY
jgi:hypothetical protein